MMIAGMYSFNRGQEEINKRYPSELKEIEIIINNIEANKFKTKFSKEKTMRGRMLYNPIALNNAFRVDFESRGWHKRRVHCAYASEYYTPDYSSLSTARGAYREMDFVKDRLGVEVQFGKYAFMVYNVCAKMTIFHNMNVIDLGVEIVPVKDLAHEMSSGVSYFEQFVWDLQHRGIADIDIPVLILGIAV